MAKFPHSLAILLFSLLAIFRLDAQTLTTAPWVDLVPESELPEAAQYNGRLVEAMTWDDAGGKNYFIVSEVAHEKELKNDLFVYQYVKNSSGTKLLWDIKDFSQTLAEVHVVGNSLQVLDLDQDGLMETCFMYEFPSDGADPKVLKMMLHTKGQKLAIRGSIPVMEEGKPEKNIDPAVSNYPTYFKSFMSTLWDEYVTDYQEVEYAKTVALTGPGYRLMELWYNYASGGISYRILDANGKPLQLADGLSADLNSSSEVISLGNNRIVYVNLPKLGLIDLQKKTGSDLVTFFEDTEAVSSVVSSPSNSKVAFFALNHSYQEGTKLFVLTLDGDNVVNKQKFDLPTFRMAASAWVIGSPRFLDENTIEYTHWTNPDDPGEARTVKID